MSAGLRFGRVEVQPQERRVLVDSRPVVVGARAFDLLIALVDRRDRLVGKNELLDIVWPHLVVEENNLMVQISALRKVLGPQAIATIPGRGYRFTMAADDVPEPAPASPRRDPPASEAAARPVVASPPVLATTLQGRSEELAELHALLQRQRLVTLVGAGGIGKSLLALAAVQTLRGAHRDGIAWVSLADIVDPSLLASAVAQAAGLPVGGGDDPLPALVAALAPLQMLLVIDSAEPLLDAVARLARALLAQAPAVRLLVTSQAPLRIDAEHVFRLGALSVPAPGTSAAQAITHGAVALFVDQALAADRRFALTDANVSLVIALCGQLDGVALGIKLAAARLPLLGLAGLAAKLGDRLRLLGGAGRGAPHRQQTLRAALDWSHGLLSASEQAVLRRLCVFAGGFTLAQASAVAGDEGLDDWAVIDALEALVDRSFVALEGSEIPRYRLSQTTREYAGFKLDEAGERAGTQQRHAQALAAALDEACDSYWSTPDELWLAAWAPEIDNVRAALDWSAQRQPELGVRLVGAASVLFMLLGMAAEARQRCKRLEGSPAALASTPQAARYWCERARLHWGVSDALMSEFALRAAALCRTSGDARGLYLALRCAAGSPGTTPEQGQAMVAEMAALEDCDWPPRLRSQRLLAQAGVATAAGRFDQARDTLQALLALARSAGLESTAVAALAALAQVQLSLGDADAALRHAREVQQGRGLRRDNFVLQALASEAQAHLMRAEPGLARAALADFLATSRSRDWEWFDLYADLFALLAAQEGRADAAARLVGHADAASQRVGARAGTVADARARAWSAVEAALGADVAVRLMSEGALMDKETVCALALAAAPARARG